MKKNMKLKAGLLLGAAAMLMTISGCGKKTTDRTAEIKKSGTLRVAISTGRSRLAWVDDSDGSYQGLEPAIAKAIADGFDVQVSFVPAESGRPLTELIDQDEADMAIGSITDDGGLSASYGVTTPYAYGYLCAVTSRGNFVNTLAALDESNVGISSYLTATSLLNLNGVETASQTTYTETEGRKALEKGEIVAYICYEDEAVSMVEDSDGLFQAQNLTDAGAEGFVAITNKDNKTLLEGMEAISQAYLDAIQQNSTSETSQTTD